MKKKFKYPCAVKTDDLTDEQGDTLQEAFIRLGACLCDRYESWNYYGVDYTGDINSYTYLDSFADEDEEVILYTYDEVMSFVAELEQPKEAQVTKKQLKFPCAIAMSEITSQEVYDKVFNAFIEAGAKIGEDHRDDYKDGSFTYFGVDGDMDTMHWDNFEFGTDPTRSATLYSLEDILGATDQQETLSEPLGDVLADTPSVSIKEGGEGGTEASGEVLLEKGFVKNSEGGVKGDGGKPRWSLLDFQTLSDVVDVLELGATKYSAGNYKHVEPIRYVDAFLRHWYSYQSGEELDGESGKSHLHHMICCLMFLDYFRRQGEGINPHG